MTPTIRRREQPLTERDFPFQMHGPFRPAITRCRCPRCGSTTLELTERSIATTSWEVRDGKLNLQAGFHEPGEVLSVGAQCTQCSHRWTLRSVLQITNAVTMLDPETFQPIEE